MAGVFTIGFKDYFLSQIPTTIYLQLHTGNPTETGENAVSTITGRKAFTLGTPANGTVSNTDANSWNAPNGIVGTEDLTHYSVWTASSGGAHVGYGTLTTPRLGVTSSDVITVDIGDLDFSINDPA